MTSGRPGTFILSLDCEGKWGMADHLDRFHDETLTSARLSRTYEALATMFRRLDIKATFAFVMAFLLREEEREGFRDLLVGDPGEHDPWLSRYRHALSTGSLEGWHLPEALAIARSAPGVEIACHGFCHRPLSDSCISDESARAELAGAQRAAELKGIELRTLIFPRNRVGHLQQVRDAGFIGYRTALPTVSGIAGRGLRIAEEFNLWRAPQPRLSVQYHGLAPIPAGYFFNWRYGIRRWVPSEVTQLRWRNLLRRGARGGVVHLWFHPHNLITAPDMADSLERVLAEVAQAQSAGWLKVMTQEEYCREQLSQTATAV